MKKVLLFLCALVAAQMANAWYLVGIGGDWANAKAPTKIEGNYEYWENLTLTSNESFKIRPNQNNWDGALGNYGYHDGWMSGGPLSESENNATWTGSAGTYTFKFDTSNKSLTITKVAAAVKETLIYSVTVPAGTPACYIAGEMNGWSFTPMTKVDDTHYTITYPQVMRSTEYKYSAGPSWDYEELKADGGNVGNRKYSDSDVVAKFKKLYYPETITAGMYYLVPGEWEDENVALYAAEFINKNTETSEFVQGFLNDHYVYFQLKEGKYSHVKFYQVENPNKSTTATVIEDFATMTVLAETEELTYTAPEADKIMRYNVDESKWEEVVIGSGVNRVEMANGIGYAYGVVSAEGAIEVYNVNGAVVARGNDTIDLRGLGRGVYIIRNGNQVRKVVR